MQSGIPIVARALATYVAWIVIGVGGAALLTGGKTPLDELVSHRIGLQFVASCLLLIATIRFAGWPVLGFVKPQQEGWWKLLWLPAAYIAVFVVLAVKQGLASPAVIGFVLVNTAMVGFSEETMFRGILFQAFRKAMPIWPAIALSTILFGAVHVLNGFITGDFTAAFFQSLAAAMSGLLFAAILIRSGWIWPPIVVHALWDFTIFMMANQDKAPAAPASPSGSTWVAHVLFVLPSFVYALFLLRRIPQNVVTQDK